MTPAGPTGQHPAIRPRRLVISGGSRLGAETARFWECLGRAFAHEAGLLIVSGGLMSRNDAPGTIAADWAFIKGLKAELAAQRQDVCGRVETLLPSRDRDSSTMLTRFREGTVVELRNRNAQSRRFFMVNSADVVVAIAGEAGTRTILDLALAIEKPVLPLPFSAGSSGRVWQENLEDIMHWFQISGREARRLGEIDLARITNDQLKKLAARVKRHILKGFITHKCLVIMPFARKKVPLYDLVIQPVLESLRVMPIRVDRLGLTGNAMDVFKQALSSCHGVIADISDNNPNVMYELGMAHAENKPTIILRDELDRVPFDLRNQYIIDCSVGRDRLRACLTDSVKQIFG